MSARRPQGSVRSYVPSVSAIAGAGERLLVGHLRSALLELASGPFDRVDDGPHWPAGAFRGPRDAAAATARRTVTAPWAGECFPGHPQDLAAFRCARLHAGTRRVRTRWH